ncbi:probable alpha-amylase 2 [Hibiscus syriacus]|uniref:probable alpha-amylase 2 n=1 Tax=Hibiscus syriacus TaxID=106335 RepID=UPI001920BCA8|nr:probable alpha-amylase 2 [Hibiscus syriacus]
MIYGTLFTCLDAHRQRIVNWINATGGTSSAFDVTTKGILHSALHGQYWRLIDPQGKPTGVMGWWPSHACTFLENHDTGSTQVLPVSLTDMHTFKRKYTLHKLGAVPSF